MTTMQVTVLQVAGIEHAMRWMRYARRTQGDSQGETIGARDERLAQALVRAPRDSHSKMCRVIQVWMDVLAPLKWWKQFDTYKVGTTALSTSTMNNIMDGVTAADFSPLVEAQAIELVQRLIEQGDEQRVFANLPLDYLQLRGVLANYQVLRNVWLDRRHHKLVEWQAFLAAIREQCPYAQELIFVE